MSLDQSDSSTSEDSQRAEIEQYLEHDATVLGLVYRGISNSLSDAEIADQGGAKTSNFVWNYRRIIRALLERELPTAPTVALQLARRYRSLLKHDWSEAARQRLTTDLGILESRATDVEAVAKENDEATKQTKVAEDLEKSGIYVYALPHYLRYPVDADSGRTLLKVGRSDRDVIKRIRAQTRTTALPEEPVLLRIYPTGDQESHSVESQIHKTLRAFDHGKAADRMAGKEWFLTTTNAIDAIADLLGLDTIVVVDTADYLEVI